MPMRRSQCCYCERWFNQPISGRGRLYCKRSHRQRAYERRRSEGLKIKAFKSALSWKRNGVQSVEKRFRELGGESSQ